ncbi:hypothetical protein CFK38_05125 [Brachybacterium vulturis]|uniref:LppM domain-containing protein n=1 Tax=Brachybacterium vulturis TaxID=2017484 RepID=A0A291GL81_9MICO|nr:hypothetical protein [Brachybacterium vulturis]ATG50981.1 hypothetical protein CFK38_05125 [Brachybacterium vulturis]
MNSISTGRRLIAVLLLPFLMVLAGCGKLHADLEIQDVDTINLSYDLAIDKDFATGVYDDANTMCSEMTEELSVGGELAPEVEPYEKDGQLGCLVSGVMTRDNFGSDLSLTEEDGEYHLVLTGDDAAQFEDPAMAELDFDFRMTFTFPGEVIESNGGEIDGNSVTYTDLQQVTQGVDIRADAGDFPWVIVIVVVLVLGFLFLLLLAAIAFFVIRARRNKGGGSTPAGIPGGYGAAAAAGTATPQGQQWGQASPPPAPQPPQAPQDEQPWSRPPQDGQQWGQPGQDRPGQGQQPPQNPGW